MGETALPTCTGDKPALEQFYTGPFRVHNAYKKSHQNGEEQKKALPKITKQKKLYKEEKKSIAQLTFLFIKSDEIGRKRGFPLLLLCFIVRGATRSVHGSAGLVGRHGKGVA